MNRREVHKKATTCFSTLVDTARSPVLMASGHNRDYSTSESSSCSMSSIKMSPGMKDTIESSSTSSSQRQSSSSIEKLDDNFFGAFQEHYDYLMDKGLIETCQVGATTSSVMLSSSSSCALSTSGSNVAVLKPSGDDYENMSGNVSFKEFLHQYNELNKWLEQMLCFNQKAASSNSEKYTNQVKIIKKKIYFRPYVGPYI